MTAKEILANSKLSKDQLGRLLHERLKSSESVIRPRSLATKIGELERGNIGWWEKRLTHQQALAALLDVDVAELFPMAEKDSKFRSVRFDSFYLLSPLNLREENPCKIGSFSSSQGVGNQIDPLCLRGVESPRIWCVMPLGSGKTLLSRWYEFRYRSEIIVLSVQKSEELELHLAIEAEGTKKKLLMLDLNCELESRVITQLERRDKLVVFTSLGLPSSKGSTNVLEEPMQGIEPNPLPTPQNQNEESWLVLHWVFYFDWRKRFVSWCVGRLGEGKDQFPIEKVLDWLEVIDPSMDKFSSPEELLPLLEFVYKEGMKELKEQRARHFAEQWLQRKMSSFKEESDSSRGEWLAIFGVKTVEALLKGRWSDSSVSWRGELPRQTWAKWLPPNSLVEDGDVYRDIDELVKEKKEDKREDIALNLKKKLSRTKPEIVMEYLQHSFVFRVRASQRLEIHPKWLEDNLVQGTIQSALEKESPEVWGRWWVASDRRPLIDRTLDLLEDEAFERLIEKVIKAFDKQVLGKAGAVEAMFSAVARRLQPEIRKLKKRSQWSGNREVLWRLWECQESLFCDRYRDYDEPPLSPLLRDFQQDFDWIADSWSWSVWCPKPKKLPNEKVKKMFPGWCDSFSLSKLDIFYTRSLSIKRSNFAIGATFWSRNWLTTPSGDTSDPEFHDWRILHLAPEVLKFCTDKVLPKYFPSLLLPALVFSEDREEWNIKEKIRILLGEIYLWEYVQHCVKKSSVALEEKIANFIFFNYLNIQDMSILYAFESIKIHYLHTYTFLSEHISATEFGKQWCYYLDHVSKNDIDHFPKNLPERLNLIAMKSYLSYLKKNNNTSSLKKMMHLSNVNLHYFPIFSKENELKILDDLAEALKEDNEFSFIAERYWKLDPQKAMELTVQSLSKSPPAKESIFWVHSAPNSWLEKLIDWLEFYEEKNTIPWLHSWSARKMHEAPMWADALYRLFLSSK